MVQARRFGGDSVPVAWEPYDHLCRWAAALSTFWNEVSGILVQPDAYDGTMCTRQGLQFIPHGSRRVSQAVTLSTSSIPGLIVGVIAVNLATYPAIPVFGAGKTLNSPHIAGFTLTVLEMMAFCVILANLLDLTLVLRKRMSPHRAAIEIPLSFFSSMFATLPIAFAVLQDEHHAWKFVEMVRAMVWPLLGKLDNSKCHVGSKPKQHVPTID